MFAPLLALALLAIGSSAGAVSQYDEPAAAVSAWSASLDEHDDGACPDRHGGVACSTATCCAAIAPPAGAVVGTGRAVATYPWSIRTLGRATSVAPPTRPPIPRDPT